MENDLGTTMFSGKLLPHQRDGLDFLTTNPRSLLADDVGLGKTIQALALVALLLAEDPSAKALVLTDLSLVDQWLNEAARFLPGVTTSTLDRVSAARGGFPSITVGNYAKVGSYLGGLERERFSLVILDEANSIKSAGVQHANVSAVTATAARVVGLTATALEITPEETYAILTAIGTPLLPPRPEFERLLVFSPPYVTPTGRRVPRSFLDYAPGGAEAFRTYLDTVSLRRTGDEVGLTLPTQVGPAVEWVRLNAAQAAAYRSAGNLRDGLARFQARQGASRLAEDGTSVLADAAMRRWDATPREKTIAYAFNHAPLDAMGAHLEGRGVGYVRISGSTSAKARTAALAAFQHDPEVMFLLGTDVLQSGLNLQFCRRLWSLDSTWNPASEAQREGRIRRYGSPHDTFEHVTFLPDVPLVRDKWATLARRSGHADAVGL